METVVKDSTNFKYAVNQLCLEEHSNFLLIIQSAFNYFAKNELKRLNAPKLEDPGPMVKKIQKLTGKSSIPKTTNQNL